MKLEDLTEETVKQLSDREVQEKEHDVLVDITHDIGGGTFLHDKYTILKNERELRQLESLPPLNGMMSWDDDYD